MALTWVKIGNLKGPKGDAGDTTAMNRFDAIEAKNVTQDTRLTAVESKNTEQDGRLTTNESKNTTQDGRLTSIESKNTEQDGRLTTNESAIAGLQSRGVLPDGTNLNTLSGTTHVGTYSLLTTYTYPNAPTVTLPSTATLEVARGASNAAVHRITSGSVLLWREAVDTTAGTWSAWEQVETAAVAASKQSVKCVRLESGAWVWDIAGTATHYVIPDHDGSLVIRATAQPVPASTPALNW